jgi:hypothetical protein
MLVLDLSLEELNAGTLVVASLLLLRSFFRASPRDLDVYPSHIGAAGIGHGASGRNLSDDRRDLGEGGRICRHGQRHSPSRRSLAWSPWSCSWSSCNPTGFRMRLGRFVSRHFERPLYDYRTVMAPVHRGHGFPGRSDGAVPLAGEACGGPVSGAFRGDLDRRRGFHGPRRVDVAVGSRGAASLRLERLTWSR